MTGFCSRDEIDHKHSAPSVQGAQFARVPKVLLVL
jgi:hypothetical protein